jgi:hypothetical protein
VREGFALVAREGDAQSGQVVSVRRYLDKGGRASVTLGSAKGYERVTAVIVNADGRVRDGDRVYSRDGRRFEVQLSG